MILIVRNTCVRHKYLQSADDPFIQFLHLISLVYHLPQQQSGSAQGPAHSLQQPASSAPAGKVPTGPVSTNGLLSAADVDVESASARCRLSTNIDVANFELQFDLSDISDSKAEDSGDMFI